MQLICWRKAVNDNGHHRYGIVESFGLNQFAVAEYDELGPIMRLGPYASRHQALDRMNALLAQIVERRIPLPPGGRAAPRRR